MAVKSQAAGGEQAQNRQRETKPGRFAPCAGNERGSHAPRAGRASADQGDKNPPPFRAGGDHARDCGRRLLGQDSNLEPIG